MLDKMPDDAFDVITLNTNDIFNIIIFIIIIVVIFITIIIGAITASELLLGSSSSGCSLCDAHQINTEPEEKKTKRYINERKRGFKFHPHTHSSSDNDNVRTQGLKLRLAGP